MEYKEWQGELRKRGVSRFHPDWPLRWQPEGVDVPIAMAPTAKLNIVGLQELDILQQTLLQGVDIENQTTLQKVSIPYLSSLGDSTSVVIKTCAALSSLDLPRLILPQTAGGSLDFSGCSLTAVSVDNLINGLSMSLSSGVTYHFTVNVSGGHSAAPTSASSLALSSLTSAGVTVTHN